MRTGLGDLRRPHRRHLDRRDGVLARERRPRAAQRGLLARHQRRRDVVRR